MSDAKGELVRLPYHDSMPSAPVDHPLVRDIDSWFEARLAAHGFSSPGSLWDRTPLDVSREEARALHATLVDIAARCDELPIDARSSVDDHLRRWPLNRHAEVIVRLLTKNSTPLDGGVFTELYEWSGSDGMGGAVELYLTYAPIKTLRSVEPWLYDTTARPGVPVHDRAFLLRPLGRIDPESAVSRGRELFDESPWAISEVLGMFGGRAELEFLTFKHLGLRKRGMADVRRRVEVAIRKLEKKMSSPPS